MKDRLPLKVALFITIAVGAVAIVDLAAPQQGIWFPPRDSITATVICSFPQRSPTGYPVPNKETVTKVEYASGIRFSVDWKAKKALVIVRSEPHFEYLGGSQTFDISQDGDGAGAGIRLEFVKAPELPELGSSWITKEDKAPNWALSIPSLNLRYQYHFVWTGDNFSGTYVGINNKSVFKGRIYTSGGKTFIEYTQTDPDHPSYRGTYKLQQISPGKYGGTITDYSGTFKAELTVAK